MIAFIGSVAFWWIYFDRSAEAGTEVMATATDPGRLGVTAYTYFHVPMVAGIIAAAAAYEVALAHPGDQLNTATACLILGGPARFLVGHALFKWALWGYVPRSRCRSRSSARRTSRRSSAICAPPNVRQPTDACATEAAAPRRSGTRSQISV